MKKLIHTATARRASLVRPLITLVIGLLLALLSAALTYSAPPAMDETTGDPAFLVLQPKSTPQSNDLSEIGSTDGIVVMGFVIALIVIVPILLRRRSWLETR
ncbi:MAG TPA: hypothetical protein VJ830_05780 [Anaerolineales bacterium]|nr:hypothetical protein [Anaerolineales bacterium]